MEKGERELGSAGTPPRRLGVSLCPLGGSVRYDGGHKKDAFLTGSGFFKRELPPDEKRELGEVIEDSGAMSEPAKLTSAPRRGDATLAVAAGRSGALSRYPARPSAAGTLLAVFPEP